MAVVDTLQELATDLTNAYDSIDNKGGTLPSDKNTNNLATAIDSIQTGITPSGTINITEEGVYDVTQFETANVEVFEKIIVDQNFSNGAQVTNYFRNLGENNKIVIFLTTKQSTSQLINNELVLIMIDGNDISDSKRWRNGVINTFGHTAEYDVIIRQGFIFYKLVIDKT